MSGTVDGGRSEITWDGRAASGRRLGHSVYFARLTTPAGTKTTKFVHLGR
jgi:hypothetical protein